jgi:hypothetical protein
MSEVSVNHFRAWGTRCSVMVRGFSAVVLLTPFHGRIVVAAVAPEAGTPGFQR